MFYTACKTGTAPYDTTFAIEPEPHLPDLHLVWVRVTWTPRGGEPVTIEGLYLDAIRADGYPYLGDGTTVLVAELGLSDELDTLTDDELTRLLATVNDQFNERPTATLRCPSGELRLTLIPRGD